MINIIISNKKIKITINCFNFNIHNTKYYFFKKNIK